MDAYIAVDAGGTQIRAALFQAGAKNIEPLNIQRLPTRSKPQAFDVLTSTIEAVWPQDMRVRGIGVAVPGPLDPVTGIISFTANISDWENFPLKEKLETYFNVPAAVGNDANMAALGEWKYGAGVGHQNLIYITISTGIGSGIISDGRLLLGHRGLAGELGHITVIPENGPMCGCGKRGHLESVASGTGIARYVTEQLANGRTSLLTKAQPNAREIGEAARQGDELSIEAYQRAGTYLGRSFADCLHIFNPSILILGGGVTKSADLFFEAMHAAIESSVISPDYTTGLTITFPALGDSAGLQGARSLAEISFS
ncbi:MAG: ROK family protein [Anaerolineaceae bacterium]|jgi:glucokinase|nr:ROK family protein [Anaerolineaceae bacterium]